MSLSPQKLLLISTLLLCVTSVLPAGADSVFSGGSWLRDSEIDWSASRSKSDVQRLAEEARNGDVKAMRRLGIISMKGIKVKPSAKIAIKWWKMAAEEGDAHSMMYLGDVYKGGNGVRKDAKRALQYYAEALEAVEEKSNTIADDNHIIIKRIKKMPLSVTINWWKERCEDGDSHAMYYLATLEASKRKGLLTDEDAEEYLQQAAEAGHTEAKAKVKSLAVTKGNHSHEDDEIALGSEADNEEISSSARAARKKLAELGHTPTEKTNEVYGELLLKFAKEGELNKVKLALQSGADVNTKDSEDITPILWAAAKGHTEVVKLLLSTQGIEINTSDKDGMTPLYGAARAGYPNIVRLLLAVPGIDVNAVDKHGASSLYWAAREGHADIVKQLLAVPGIKVNSLDEYNCSPLHWAAVGGKTDVVKLLLAAPGIDINTQDMEGWSSLHAAAVKGHTEIVKLLLAVPGININTKDKEGGSPLHAAAYVGQVDVVKLLLAATKVEVNKTMAITGFAPLHSAILGERVDVVKLLLADSRIDVNLATPLHKTDAENISTVVNAHQKNEFDESGLDKMLAIRGVTPLHLAAFVGNMEVLKLLLADSDIKVNNAMSIGGIEPLHFAAFRGNTEVVKLFLAAPGIKVNSKDDKGRTPLHYAESQGHTAVVALLKAAEDIEANKVQGKGQQKRGKNEKKKFTYTNWEDYVGVVVIVILAAVITIALLAYKRKKYSHTPIAPTLDNFNDVTPAQEASVAYNLSSLKEVYICIPGGEKEGPYPVAMVRDGFALGLYLDSTMIWLDAAADWRPIQEVFPSSPSKTMVRLSSAKKGALKNKVIIFCCSLALFALLSVIACSVLDVCGNSTISKEKACEKLRKYGVIENFYEVETAKGRRALEDACEQGDIKVVRLLIAGGAAMTSKAFFSAIEKGHVDIVKLALEASDIDINYENRYSNTALQLAARYGNIELVQLLLAVPGIDVNRGAPLVYAAYENKPEIVKLLLKTPRIDVNQTSSEGRTALTEAAMNQNVKLVKLLLQVPGINVNKGGPLAQAAAKGNMELVRILSSVPGCHINQSNYNKGETPLCLAAEKGHAEVVKFLLSIDGIDINQGDVYSGSSPLYNAAFCGHTEVVRILLSRDEIDVNAACRANGFTPLYSAAFEGHVQIVKLLLSMPGIDVNKAGGFNNSQSPLWAAQTSGHREIESMLKAAGAKK